MPPLSPPASPRAAYKSDFFVRHEMLFIAYVALLTWAAFVWRRLMFRTTFVAITGSVGKTTAKDCLAGVLSLAGCTAKSFGTANWLPGVQKAILRARPWHRFVVIEVAAAKQGAMRHFARLVRPDVALVLAVRQEHMSEFPTPEATAKEKGVLVESVRRRGGVILNGDDPYVSGMAARCRATVQTFGRSPGHAVWYEDVRSGWPSRLRFRVHAGAQSREIETRLVGEHWVNSVVGAIAAAHACGMDMDTIARGMAGCMPSPGRMQPVELPNGAVIIRDEYSSAPDSFAAAVSVLRQATARRRIAVVSEISETGMTSAECYRFIGRSLAGAADLLIFVGGTESRLATQAAVEAGVPLSNVRDFERIRDAAEYLKSELRGGDLVVLKGRMRHHLSRIFYAQLGDVACWPDCCDRRYLCDECEDFHFVPAEGGYGRPL